MSKRIVTSTPIGGGSNALKEAQWKNIMQSGYKNKKNQFFSHSDSPYPYVNRSQNSPQSHFKVPKKFKNKQLLEKRRSQAIEAMQIAEQRRLRLMQKEEKDAEMISQQMENLNLGGGENNSSEFLPDGRLKLDKKRLIARRMKERRIRMALAEQERRKRLEMSKRGNNFIHRPVYRIPQRSRSFRVSRNLSRFESTVVEKKEDRRNIIRYTKEELRALNPYGYYFL